MIKGISDKQRIPRLGKIRLGSMVKTKNGDQTRPQISDHFIVPPDVAKVYGENPTVITDVYLPTEDREVVFNQYLKRYTYSALACKGTGETAKETVVETGELRDIPCDPEQCHWYQEKKCKSLASLVFCLPRVPGLGIWQMDTTSYYTIVSINNSLNMIHRLMGRISNVPLELRRVKKQIQTREKGKPIKRDIWVVELNTPATLFELAKSPANPFAASLPAAGQLAIDAPSDAEAPDESLIAESEAEVSETAETVIDTKTGEVTGFIAATPAQINSLKIIMGQRAEAGIPSDPIDFDKLSAEEAKGEIRRLQAYKDQKPMTAAELDAAAKKFGNSF